MLRIIDGIAFEGKPSGDRWEVRRRVLSDGHVEMSARRAFDWHEVPYDPAWRDMRIAKYGEAHVLAEEAAAAAEREAANRERAARRAKTKVRHLCKVQGLDTLLTLTYRENQRCQDLAWKHLREFVRRMRRALGEFSFVAVPERQSRGAVHWHLAVHRLPSVMSARNGVKVKAFNVVRAIWRAVVGELGGNIDVSRRKRAAARSPARIASYIAKYVTKAFEGGEELGAHRYSSSLGVGVPPAEYRQIYAATLPELLGQVYGDAWGPGLRLVSAWLCPYGDGFYFAAESVTASG